MKAEKQGNGAWFEKKKKKGKQTVHGEMVDKYGAAVFKIGSDESFSFEHQCRKM